MAKTEFKEAKVKCQACGETSTIRRPTEHPEDCASLRWECPCGAVHELSISEAEAALRALGPPPSPNAGKVFITASDRGGARDKRA